MSSSPSRPHRGAWAPVPTVRNEAASPAAELVRARRPVGLLLAQVGEERSREPRLDEFGYARVAGFIELRRERLVVLPAQPAIRLVLDARVRPDEDEPLHELRCLQRQLQAATSAERVPDVGRPAPRLPDERGRLGQARAGVGSRRAAVTRKIRGYDLGVGCELTCDPAPGRTRLGESVNEHDSRRCALRPAPHVVA